MGRPKTNNIDGDKILLRIFALTIQRKRDLTIEIRELRKECESLDYYSDRAKALADQVRTLSHESDQCNWLTYDVRLLAGRALSPAERRAWQRAVLELERTNFIAIAGRRGSAIQLKRKGKERCRDLQKQK